MTGSFCVALTILSISFRAPDSNAVYGTPVCSAFYGQPNAPDCFNLLWATRSVRHGRQLGLALNDRDSHVFAQAGVLDPGDDWLIIGIWSTRIDLPIYRGNGAAFFQPYARKLKAKTW